MPCCWVVNARQAHPQLAILLLAAATYAVDASRALVAGHLGDASVLRAFIIFAVLAVFGLIWATRSLRQAMM